MFSKEKCFVLIADDSEEDRFFLKNAIAKAAPKLEIVGDFHNGQLVVSYLTGQGQYADRERYPLPKLLIVDWRMPGMGGREIIEWLKENPVPGIKVAVVADSSGIAHKSEILDAGALFFEKKMNPQELIHTARLLQKQFEDKEA